MKMMLPIYFVPILFILSMLFYYYLEYKRLINISQKLHEILKNTTIIEIKFHHLHTSIFPFDKTKFIRKIDNMINLLLINHNVSILTRRYAHGSYLFNSTAVYKSFDRKLDKLIN